MLQAAMGVEPDPRSGAWVVLGGFVQASLSTTQPKYLAHDLHASPPCLTLPRPDHEGAALELRFIQPARFGL